MSFLRVLLLSLYLMLCTAMPAFAACTSPAGVAGAREWFTNTYKFCDGTNWISFNDAGTLGSCSSTGQMEFTSATGNYYYKVCDGTNQKKIKCQPDSGEKQIFLTTPGTGTWTVPADWNSAANTIEAIGGGGGGGGSGGAGPGKGGGGGAYGAIYNFSTAAGSTISIKVGAGGTAGAAAGSGTTGGDTWFNAASCAAANLCAKGGSFGASGPGAGGAGGAANGAGTTRYAGGAGAGTGGTGKSGSGGGGSGGPNGNGTAGGGLVSGGANDVATTQGGGGGGGGGGGLAAANPAAGATGGTAGGSNASLTTGGAGGTSGNAGTAGTNGTGGGGGGRQNTTGGGAGGAGTEWDATHGSGGGGGGGGGGTSTGPGAAGGAYGGGGGGGGGGVGNKAGGAGAQGIIVITYVPVGNGPGNCSNIGGTCNDGTVYAGLSPDGNVPMYTTPAEAPGTYSWSNGTGGADLSLTDCFGDGPTHGSFDGSTGCIQGQTNTKALISFTDSAAPYQAAVYCNNLVANGHSDWYLPSNYEAYVMMQNSAAIGGFTSWNYWTSSESHIGTDADTADFSTAGSVWRATKNNAYKVRCVRKDTMVGGTPPACGASCAALTTCTNTQIGKVDYIGASNVLAYCDGTNWLPVAPTGTMSGLAAQWKLDEGTGTTTADSSGNGNTMTLVSGPTWTTGRMSNGLSFDATNDYTTAANSASLNLTGAITVMAWVKITAFNASFNDVITKGNDASSRYAWQVSIGSDGRPAFYYCVGANAFCGTSYNVSANTGVITSTGVWYHLAVAYNDTANTVAIYVNGVAQATGGNGYNPSIVSNTDPVRLGFTSATEPGNMVIDDARIYNRTLSAAEVQSIYNSGAGCP